MSRPRVIYVERRRSSSFLGFLGKVVLAAVGLAAVVAIWAIYQGSQNANEAARTQDENNVRYAILHQTNINIERGMSSDAAKAAATFAVLNSKAKGPRANNV